MNRCSTGIAVFLLSLLCCLGQVEGQSSPESPKATQQVYVKEYEFSEDWFTLNIPVWEKFFGGFKGKPGLSYLEIGVYEGRSFLWVLENILTDSTARATCIDPFYERVPGIEERYRRNVERSGVAYKITTMKGFSEDKLKELSPGSFDIIYIDGSHKARDVMVDAVLSWPLLKSGGVLVFDDYIWETNTLPLEYRPVSAIDAFITAYRNELVVMQWSRQVVVRKRKPQYGFPIGDYRYQWREKKLVRSESGELVALSPEETAMIDSLFLSRGFGAVDFSPSAGLQKQTGFPELVQRLGLHFEKSGKSGEGEKK